MIYIFIRVVIGFVCMVTLCQGWVYITIENVERDLRSVKKYVYRFQTAKIYAKSEGLDKDLRGEINER